MTGTKRFCVKTCLRAATGLLPVFGLILAAADASGQTRPEDPAQGALHNRFSSALSDELPPAQYGTYQYVGPFPRSPAGRGFQFAEPQPGTASDELRDVQQTQYPLSDFIPGDQDGGLSAGPTEPHWVPPILAPPVESTPANPQGWGLKNEVQSDLTHVFGSGNTLGITTLTGRLILESSRLPGFSVRPHFGWHLLNGPSSTDLPGQLYDATLEFRQYCPFGDRWIGEFALAPGVFSDFANTSSQAFRLVGRGVAYYRWSANLRFAGGVTYLDREDILLLPIAGIIWTPTPDDRLEILFPQPRIAHRYRNDGNHERWVYLSGELGGGSWAIERSSGLDDVVSYRDLRLITGIEFKTTDKASWRIEGGYVFGRQLEYLSQVGNYDPRSTTMVRAAVVF